MLKLIFYSYLLLLIMPNPAYSQSNPIQTYQVLLDITKPNQISESNYSGQDEIIIKNFIYNHHVTMKIIDCATTLIEKQYDGITSVSKGYRILNELLTAHEQNEETRGETLLNDLL